MLILRDQLANFNYFGRLSTREIKVSLLMLILRDSMIGTNDWCFWTKFNHCMLILRDQLANFNCFWKVLDQEH